MRGCGSLTFCVGGTPRQRHLAELKEVERARARQEASLRKKKAPKFSWFKTNDVRGARRRRRRPRRPRARKPSWETRRFVRWRGSYASTSVRPPVRVALALSAARLAQKKKLMKWIKKYDVNSVNDVRAAPSHCPAPGLARACWRSRAPRTGGQLGGALVCVAQQR